VKYHPFYCEENVWWLCQEPALADRRVWAAFVSNERRRCALWRQRAGSPIVWDYHVVVIACEPLEVWDLDTVLPCPVPLDRYLAETFMPVPPELGPRFRLVERAELLARFSTDRSHMRAADGGWTAPPPPWDPPSSAEPPNLMRFVDMTRPFAGEVLSLGGLRDRFLQGCQ